MASNVKAAVALIESRDLSLSGRIHQGKSAELKKPKGSYLYLFRKRIKQFLVRSRFAGLPITLLYGIFIYSYLTYMVLPDVETDDIKETEGTKIPETHSCFSKQVLDLFSNNTSSRKFIKMTSERPDNVNLRNHHIGLLTSSTLTLTVGVASIFSRHTRCILTLIMPGIVTGRGRAFLLTVVLGLLIEGPLNSINYNINQIIESTICMYNSMKNTACFFANQIQRAMNYIPLILNKILQKITENLRKIQMEAKKTSDAVRKDLEKRKRELQEHLDQVKKDIGKVRNIFNSIRSPCGVATSAFSKVKNFYIDFGARLAGKRLRRSMNICGASVTFPDISINNMDIETLNQLNRWAKDLVPDFHAKIGVTPNVRKLMNAPSVADIRKKLLNIVKDLFNQLRYLKYAKKFFLLFSLIFLALSAVRYLLNYYSDDSYDNKFVDDNLRKLWRHEDYEKLTPIRRWELDEKYQVSASIKLSRKELKGMVVRTFPTIVMIIISLFLIIGDFGLSQLLRTLLANGKFAISFTGMEEGFGAEAMFNIFNKNTTWNMKPLKLEKLDLSTDPCLPKPLVTDKKKNIVVAVILLIMLLSSFFDVYAMRLRANICNIFYKRRAKERAMYLHEVILSGRRSRHVRLQKIIMKELQRRKRRQKFSWLFKVVPLCFKIKSSKNLSCPGCLRKTEIEDTTKLTVSDKENKLECQLCNDCYKDY